MPSSFDLNAFQLENAAFEIRYPMALLLWDRSGQLWTECQKKWPELVALHAEPAKTVFRANKNELACELATARIIARFPERPLKEFSEQGPEFLNMVCKHLEVDSLARIGLRLIFFRAHESAEKAAATLLEGNLVRIPVGQYFKATKEPTLPEYAIQFNGNALQTTVRIRAETRRVDFDPPPGPGFDKFVSIHEEQHGIVVDVDHAAIGTMSLKQVLLREWLAQALHVLRRDLVSFLEK